MSASDGRWQLGVVDFFDSFEHFDQFASLGSALQAATSRTERSLSLATLNNGSLMAAPYYVNPAWTLGGVEIAGTIIAVGPSSNSTYEGAIERATIGSLTGNWSFTINGFLRGATASAIAAAYGSGDQVVIRTVPLGWLCKSQPATSTSTANQFSVMPIGRYSDIFSLIQDSGEPMNSVSSIAAYRSTKPGAVRIICHAPEGSGVSATNNSRAIYIRTPVNSFSSGIRRWRASWYYRVDKANPRVSVVPAGMSAQIIATALGPSGSYLGNITNAYGQSASYSITGESPGVGSGTLMSVSGNTTDWTFGQALFGFNPEDTNAWSMLPTGGSNDIEQYATSRLNRLELQIRLASGQNTAFDVDDLCIEHAHGTSQEANGYYEMPGWPDRESVNLVSRASQTVQTYSMADGTMVRYNPAATSRSKWSLAADFQNQNVSTLRDIQSLISWQDTGKLISLRPFDDSMPAVMVGHLSIDNIRRLHPSLDIVSFNLHLDEA